MTMSRLSIYALISFLLLVGMIGVSVYFLKNVKDTSGWIEYRKYTKERLDDVYAGLLELEATQRGYIITGSDEVYETFNPTLARIQSNLGIIDSLIGGVPEQRENLYILADLIDARIDLLVIISGIAEKQEEWNSDTLKSYVIQGDHLMDNIRLVFSIIDQQEDLILQHRTIEVKNSQANAVRTLTLFSLVVLILFALMFYAIIRENRQKNEVYIKVTKSENRLKTTLSVVGDAIINLDSNGEVWGYNRATEKIFGIRNDEAIGHSISQFVSYPLSEKNNEGLKTSPSFKDLQERSGQHLELDGIKFHGAVFPIDFIMEPYHFEDETYYVATLRDISELKEKELELHNTLYDLQRSNAELEQFAYVASHDLQEPLRKIQAFGNRLMAKYNDPKEPEATLTYATKMVDAAERMQKLILSLLDFSRISRNLESQSNVDLNKILANVLEDFEFRIQEVNAQIQVDPLPTLKAGREMQLFQLFMNLIGNALKFIDSTRQPKIEVRCEEGMKDSWPALKGSKHPYQNYYRISIIDNGIGFDMKYLDKIFTIFQRLHGRTEYEGTGIGLAVCQRVAENHQGLLLAESIEGEGSQFYLYLPKD